VAQAQAVVASDTTRLRRQTQRVQDGIHEIPGTITGEGSPGAVGAMRPWRKAQNKDACSWVTKTRHRPRPVFMIDIGAASLLANAGAIFAEPGTCLALDYRIARAIKNGVGWLKLNE